MKYKVDKTKCETFDCPEPSLFDTAVITNNGPGWIRVTVTPPGSSFSVGPQKTSQAQVQEGDKVKIEFIDRHIRDETYSEGEITWKNVGNA